MSDLLNATYYAGPLGVRETPIHSADELYQLGEQLQKDGWNLRPGWRQAFQPPEREQDGAPTFYAFMPDPNKRDEIERGDNSGMETSKSLLSFRTYEEDMSQYADALTRQIERFRDEFPERAATTERLTSARLTSARRWGEFIPNQDETPKYATFDKEAKNYLKTIVGSFHGKQDNYTDFYTLVHRHFVEAHEALGVVDYTYSPFEMRFDDGTSSNDYFILGMGSMGKYIDAEASLYTHVFMEYEARDTDIYRLYVDELDGTTVQNRLVIDPSNVGQRHVFRDRRRRDTILCTAAFAERLQDFLYEMPDEDFSFFPLVTV